MQIIFNPLVDEKKYYELGKCFKFPDLTKTLCPQCRKGKLRKHGFYSRYYISKDFETELLIRRHICPCCKRTVSSLPFFCHPRRTHSIPFILAVLKHLFYKGGSLVSLLDRLMGHGFICSRQLLYQYRERFIKNLTFISMELYKIISPKDYVFKKEDKKRARQVLSLIHSKVSTPLNVSMRLFEGCGYSYLTQHHFRV